LEVKLKTDNIEGPSAKGEIQASGLSKDAEILQQPVKNSRIVRPASVEETHLLLRI
jgi:hypothetical protein